MTEPPIDFALLDPPETNPQSPQYGRRLSDYDNPPASQFRHSGWQHDRTRVYNALYRTQSSTGVLEAFRECGAHAYVLQSIEDPTQYRVAGSTCHHRFCLPCGQQRSRTIAMNVLDRLAGKPSRFLTLTLRSTTESLAELLAKLTACFARLRRTALWRKRVHGGVAFIECKYSVDADRWNTHLHCIIQGAYIKQALLSKAWKRITQDSYIVDIRLVRDEAYLIRYVTKYASKPLDHTILHDEDRLDEAVIALRGKRLATTFGDWRGVLLTPTHDEAAWKNIGSLNGVIRDALAGDPESQRIYRSLTSQDVHLPEPKPLTRAPPVVHTLTGLQALLPLTTPTRTYDQAQSLTA